MVTCWGYGIKDPGDAQTSRKADASGKTVELAESVPLFDEYILITSTMQSNAVQCALVKVVLQRSGMNKHTETSR
mgnify:CR=1 FL=1